MVAFERTGSGPPLVLLHGTNSSRAIWAPLVPALAAGHEVVAIDLPGHGASPPAGLSPPAWAIVLAEAFDALGLPAPAVVGHSAGGWTALELAKLGRASAVLALAPAGLWRRHSPLATDLGLVANWTLGRLGGPLGPQVLRSRRARGAALRMVAVHGADVPAGVAIASARTAASSRHFPRHFLETRVRRFEGGAAIDPAIPVKVVWGEDDQVARARTSRFTDGRLPAHAVVETWPDCGHMVMWDQPERLLGAVRSLPVG